MRTRKTKANRRIGDKPISKARLMLMGAGSLMDLTGHYSYHRMQAAFPEPPRGSVNQIPLEPAIRIAQQPSPKFSR